MGERDTDRQWETSTVTGREREKENKHTDEIGPSLGRQWCSDSFGTQLCKYHQSLSQPVSCPHRLWGSISRTHAYTHTHIHTHPQSQTVAVVTDTRWPGLAFSENCGAICSAYRSHGNVHPFPIRKTMKRKRSVPGRTHYTYVTTGPLEIS